MGALDDLIASRASKSKGSALDSLIASKGGGRSLSGFAENAVTDASNVASSLYSAVTERPVETAKQVAKLGIGTLQQFVPGQQRYESEVADPFFAGFNKDMGISWKGYLPEWDVKQFAKTAYEKPITQLLNVGMVASPAESLPGRLGTAAKIANPINIAAKGVTTVAKTPAKIAKYIAGETSGLGPQAISEAYRSGRVGGTQGEAFRSGMRGELDPDAPVDVARGAVTELKKDRSTAYKRGMEGGDVVKLNFAPIEKAFENVAGVKSFRGKTVKPSVEVARQKVREALDEWKADPGAWTAEGFDALKQRIQDIGQSLNPLTEGAARHVVGNVAQAIKNEITRQAPGYARVMKAYEQASKAIDEVQKTLTGTSRTTHDTALRKLQSVLRNNAFTNYTARAKLAELISKKAPELMPMLSGMAANTWTPRGLPGKLIGGGLTAAAGYGAVPQASLLTGALAFEPTALATLLATGAAASPRVVGEVAHGLGSARGAIEKMPAAAKTAGIVTARQQSLEQAENVLGQDTLNHLKQSSSVRPVLNQWLKARQTGQGVEEATQLLASAIVQELKIDDPSVYDRIIQELGQVKGP